MAGPPTPAVLAIAAHPDDIEIQMAGTLRLLIEAGWRGHMFNLSDGDCGSQTTGRRETARIRRAEAKRAARELGARWHPPVAHDLSILYTVPLLRRVAAVVRKVRPAIVLTHPPADYMEDHTNACRLAVSAAFARAAPNFTTRPPRPAFDAPCVVYHCMPHGLMDPLRRRMIPGLFVDTSRVMDKKREALSCHRSQEAWLAATQGPDSYLKAMERMSRAIGELSGCFAHAEGWWRHSPMGFAEPGHDPLRAALGSRCRINPEFEHACVPG